MSKLALRIQRYCKSLLLLELLKGLAPPAFLSLSYS